MAEPKRIYLALILLLSVAVNIGFLRNDSFFRDDYHFIVNNPAIRDIGKVPSFFTSLSTGSSSRENQVVYRPVAAATYALNYYIGGLDPLGYHVFNLAIHLFNVVLVYLVIRAVSPEETLALGSALLFAIHPINSEVMNFINTRSSELSVSFYLLSFYFYLLKASAESKGRRLFFLSGSLFFFAASIFTKELAVTLPLVIMAHYLLFRKKRLGQGLKETVLLTPPYLIVLALYMILRHRLLEAEGLLGKSHQLYDNIWIPAEVILRQIKTLALPYDLSAFYFGFNPVAHLTASSAFALAIIAALVIAPFFIRKDLGFSLWWILLTGLPTAAFEMKSQASLILDHRLYVMAPGFAFVASFVILKASGLAGGASKKAFTVVMIIIAASFSIIHVQRNIVWGSGVSVSQDLVRKYPGAALAHYFLGESYARKNRLDEAKDSYRKSIELDPTATIARNNLAGILVAEGRLDEAASELNRIIEYNPGYYYAHFGLGYIYDKKGLYDAAVREYVEGLEVNPRSLPARLSLGDLYFRLKLEGPAKTEYRKALEIDPDSREAAERLKELMN
ncbi:MAG: tetratricopeptide repeat protein [Deltaproteobacteria bacterium]|nr:tetratricopeptide repeat protein [Deltaproteobacteria bacterium]